MIGQRNPHRYGSVTGGHTQFSKIDDRNFIEKYPGMTLTNLQPLQLRELGDKATFDVIEQIKKTEIVSQDTSSISPVNHEFTDLSFREALYSFPKKKVAIIDEDGNIIAANDKWLTEAKTTGSKSISMPRLGVNYFDFMHSVFHHDDALRSIMKLKQVISGAALYFVAHSDSRYTGDIIAHPLSDCANSLMIIHGT